MTSDSSRTPSPSGSPPRSSCLNSFDPFAVHPFTSFAGPSQHPAPPRHLPGTHPLPHPSVLNVDSHAPLPVHHPSAGYNHKTYSTVGVSAGSPSGHPAYPQANMTPSHNFQSIHVPFRQDTSSPELSEVLRRKRMGH